MVRVLHSSKSTSALELRLLGGFHAAWRGEPIEAFESQKVRVLLAYLACHADRPISRERLAGLLWPGEGQDAARRNLRQAIYNLRRALGHDESAGWVPVAVTHQTLQISPGLDWWLDVRAFDDAVRRGLARGDVLSTHELGRAAEIYRGDFLAGFFLKASEELEEWLVVEQERLREAAIQALQTLVERFAARGEYRHAIQYAQRLVEMDPLSEGSHRNLMQLCALAGRRGRALSQFEELAGLLERELGVEPLQETRNLYQAILTEDLPANRVREATAAIGPFVPLVGRAEALQDLAVSLERAIQEGARLAVVEGEAGVGKTRLIRTFLHQATSKRQVTVLQGRCYLGAPPRPFRPVLEALRGILVDDVDDDRPVSRPARQLAARLVARLEGGSGKDEARKKPRSRLAAATGASDLGDDLAALAAALCQRADGSGPPQPLILYFDDLHLAPSATLELLSDLIGRLAGLPVWMVAGCDTAGVEAQAPLTVLTRDRQRADRVTIGRLDAEAVSDIAPSLVDSADEEELTSFLHEHGQGLPLRIVELINFVADEKLLAPVNERRWAIAGDGGLASATVGSSLAELIMHRVVRLPTSARRQITLAAVIGQRFDAELLQRADGEHLGVVEIGIELVLERWLIRQFPRYWSSTPPQRDLVLFAHGARRGTFEFAHGQIRDAIYRSLNPLRRQHLHHKVALALERSGAVGSPAIDETIGHHFAMAGEAAAAVPHLRRAAAHALDLGDAETARHYLDRALAFAGRLVGGAADERERGRWESERKAIVAALEVAESADRPASD
jgi:DNA-binding SARP family transcriptional activator